jgi:hypothetical protein
VRVPRRRARHSHLARCSLGGGGGDGGSTLVFSEAAHLVRRLVRHSWCSDGGSFSEGGSGPPSVFGAIFPVPDPGNQPLAYNISPGRDGMLPSLTLPLERRSPTRRIPVLGFGSSFPLFASVRTFFQTSLRGITRDYPGLRGTRPVFVPLNPI